MVEITPELFVEKTLEMLPKIVEKLTDAVNKSKAKLENASDPQTAMQIIFQIIIELRSEIGGDILPAGITGEDMETYKTEHGAEIEQYLESNPEVQAKWVKLQQEIQEKFQNIMS